MMYYEVHGTGDPILFIHGGGGSIKLWGGPGGYVEQLSKRYMVIVADSRGQGQSTEGEGPITYGRVGYDAIHLLDYLGIRRAHFVGHSSGGVAYILIDFPERLITATLMGPIYNVANYRPEAYQEMKRQLEANWAANKLLQKPLGISWAVLCPSYVSSIAHGSLSRRCL
jgi:pimeloyl-ACP methyl ester carboxylesterase